MRTQCFGSCSYLCGSIIPIHERTFSLNVPCCMIAQAKSISDHLFALANLATRTLHALPKHKCWMANRHGRVHTSDILGGPSHLSALSDPVHLTKPKRRKPTKTYGIDSTCPMLVRYTTFIVCTSNSTSDFGPLDQTGNHLIQL